MADSQADACSFMPRRVRVRERGAKQTIRPASDWRHRTKNFHALLTGFISSMVEPMESQTDSLNGVASQSRRNGSNSDGQRRTLQKFAKSPLISFATSLTPSGLFASI